jgi:hypothetical protein
LSVDEDGHNTVEVTRNEGQLGGKILGKRTLGTNTAFIEFFE